FFFFQAEDGIRDATVTGVQTCALPIYGLSWRLRDDLHSCAPGSRVVPEESSVHAELRTLHERSDVRWATDAVPVRRAAAAGLYRDRKSTRLNSSHGSISYAVFCLTKNK